MAEPNPQLMLHLRATIPQATLAHWARALKQEQEAEKQKVNTPATNCTNSSWRKPGNAIDRSRANRNISREGKVKLKEPLQQPNNDQKEEEDITNNRPTVVTQKILIKNKAVFFGQDCELPYLQSSDAISHLLVKKQEDIIQSNKPLFNPLPSVEPAILTTLKSLHLYHTSIESLRQLGTGWNNLKELSILYGRLGDFSGLSSFSSLECLFVAFNQISSLSDLMFHPSIRCIDLQRNRVQSLEEVQYLTTMNRLEYVNLNGNPVMKVKESRRMLQQKLGKIMDVEDYTRLLDFQLDQLVADAEVLSFQGIEVSNAVVKKCNDALRGDDITVEQLYQVYLNREKQQKIQEVDFVRYEATGQWENSCDLEESANEAGEDIYFTPLLHFFQGKKRYTSVLSRYFQNRVYLTVKKQDTASSSQSPAQSLSNHVSSSRLNKLSTIKLERTDETESADKIQTVFSEMKSLDRKKNRLSLGKTRKLLEKSDKPSLINSKLISNLSSTASTMGKVVGLKRTSLLSRKVSSQDLQMQIEQRFSRTMGLARE